MLCTQVRHRVAAAVADRPRVGAGLSQHAVYAGGDGVRLVNTSAAPVRGPRDALFTPFADLARHLDEEVRVLSCAWYTFFFHALYTRSKCVVYIFLQCLAKESALA